MNYYTFRQSELRAYSTPATSHDHSLCSGFCVLWESLDFIKTSGYQSPPTLTTTLLKVVLTISSHTLSLLVGMGIGVTTMEASMKTLQNSSERAAL